MGTEIARAESLNWVDFKHFLNNELVDNCMESEIIELLKKSQSIESPLSIKYTYIYNKLIIFNKNLPFLTQSVSKKTWKALLKRHGYDVVTRNLANMSTRIPLYVLQDYIRSTQNIHLLHPSNHHLAAYGDYNYYTLLASIAIRSSGDIDVARKCFQLLDAHRQDTHQSKFIRYDEGLLSFFITISKLWRKNQDNDDITKLLGEVLTQADINILNTTNVIANAVIKLLKSFPIQSRFKYLHKIEKRISLAMTIDGQLLPGITYNDTPQFEGFSISILYFLPRKISLPLLENIKLGILRTSYATGIPSSLNKKLSPLMEIDKESYINGYKIAILARDNNKTHLIHGKDLKSDKFTRDIINNVRDRCKTASDRELRRRLVSKLLLYSALSNTELYNSLNWALGRFVNDDLIRSELLAGYNGFDYGMVDHYLHFFDELSGLAAIQGLGQDVPVNRQHVRASILQAADTGNKLLKKYLEVASHSSEKLSEFAVEEYDNLSMLLLGVLNKRFELIERLRKLQYGKEAFAEFVGKLLEPIKKLYGEWLVNKLSAKKGSAIYQPANPPIMLVQPHDVLQLYDSQIDITQVLHLPPSILGAIVACEFIDTLAEYMQKIRDEHPSNANEPTKTCYYSKIPFVISVPETRKPLGKRLRRLFEDYTPYLSAIAQEELKNVNGYLLQTEWLRSAFGINFWYKMLQKIGKRERTTVLTSTLKSLADQMSNTKANVLDYFYAVVGLAAPDRCYDMTEFLCYLHSCDTKLFLEQLDIDDILNDTGIFIEATIKEEYINMYQDNQWPTNPYQVVSKVFTLLNCQPYRAERLRCNRISKCLSTNFQQKLAELSTHSLASAVNVNIESDKLVAQDAYSNSSWFIGINLLAGSRNGANQMHVQRILTKMKENQANYTKQQWSSMLKDLITVLTPVGLQAHDSIIVELIAIARDSDQVQSQLRLFNGGLLSTIPVSKARHFVFRLFDLIGKKEIHKLTTIKLIASGMMVHAQSVMTVKEVCEHLTSIADQVDHPSIQGFIVNQLLRMVNNDLPMKVIENTLRLNFNTIISQMELSTEMISLIRDTSVDFSDIHLKNITDNLDLDAGNKPFVEAVFMRTPEDIPNGFRLKWFHSLERFANRYMVRLGVLAIAFGDRVKLSHAVACRSVPTLFKNFAIRWESFFDKDSTLLEVILQSCTRLVYALDEDLKLGSTQNGAIIDSLFNYSIDFDQEAFNSFTCLHSLDRKSDKSSNTFTWQVLGILAAHMKKLEVLREPLKALKLAQFVHECLDHMAATLIGSLEEIKFVIDTLSQSNVGVFSQRLCLHLLVYKSVLFNQKLDGGLSEVQDHFQDEYVEILAEYYAKVFDDLTAIKVTNQAVEAGVSDKSIYAYLKPYTGSALVKAHTKELLSNDKYRYVASRLLLHRV